MKLLISTIVSAIVLYFLGWLNYAVIFAKYTNEMMVMRSPEDMKMWAIIVGTILQALFLSWIYTKVYKGESPFKEGFLYGFLLSILVYVPYIFFYWASYPIRYTLVIADGISMGIRVTIATIIIGLIIGKKEKAG
jgi:hypothetical protein